MVIKMKKVNKILTELIIVFLMVSICSQVFAIDPDNYKPTPANSVDCVCKKKICRSRSLTEPENICFVWRTAM